MKQSSTIQERLRDYLTGNLGFKDVVVSHAELIFGGFSRETWRIDAEWLTADGVRTEKSMILRLDPPFSLLESNRHVEYAMYKAFWPVPGVPVPEPLFIEDDPEPLGMAFFAMSRLDGAAWPGELRQPMYKEAWSKIACQMFQILGLIAAQDCRDMGLADLLPVPSVDNAWAVELDKWEKVINDNDIGPLPVLRAAIRKLRREPPPPAPKLSVVHGDYRIGNYLYIPEGIVGVLDWEMAHLGDPIEDLGWAFAKNWHFAKAPGKIAGKLTAGEAIRIWEDASGLKVHPDAMRWWTLFTNVKAYALWVTAANKAATGFTRQLINTDAAWQNMYDQELWMLEDMGGVS
ncbi:MAG: phosphotransferase family protein [Firmicutes bacterium]|nr:phosphotransferase family protein [Bacillota bacterium]MCL5058594.1 phosphotransferase family protein [Actinomycetota bacterium]